jgi:hypothetical protein
MPEWRDALVATKTAPPSTVGIGNLLAGSPDIHCLYGSRRSVSAGRYVSTPAAQDARQHAAITAVREPGLLREVASDDWGPCARATAVHTAM